MLYKKFNQNIWYVEKWHLNCSIFNDFLDICHKRATDKNCNRNVLNFETNVSYAETE